MMETAKLLDFEVSKGTHTICMHELKRCLDLFPYGTAERIYLILLANSLRVKEPCELRWDNFNNGLVIFRPAKTKGRVLRKIKLSPKVWEEIMYYRDNHFFSKTGRVIPFDHETFAHKFNKSIRHKLGGNWVKKSEDLRGGAIAQFHYYTMRSFRTTCATLIYYYYAKVYGHGELALTKTCSFMGHSNKKMTAEYYIQRCDELGLDCYPSLPYLDFMDFMIYGEVQKRIDCYVGECQESLNLF